MLKGNLGPGRLGRWLRAWRDSLFLQLGLGSPREWAEPGGGGRRDQREVELGVRVHACA